MLAAMGQSLIALALSLLIPFALLIMALMHFGYDFVVRVDPHPDTGAFVIDYGSRVESTSSDQTSGDQTIKRGRANSMKRSRSLTRTNSIKGPNSLSRLKSTKLSTVPEAEDVDLGDYVTFFTENDVVKIMRIFQPNVVVAAKRSATPHSPAANASAGVVVTGHDLITSQAKTIEVLRKAIDSQKKEIHFLKAVLKGMSKIVEGTGEGDCAAEE